MKGIQTASLYLSELNGEHNDGSNHKRETKNNLTNFEIKNVYRFMDSRFFTNLEK